MAKKMPHTSTCKLCLQNKPLQDSHLIGRAVYKAIREDGEDPAVMTPELHMSTSRQVHDYLLCWDCEQRFREKGEDYLSQVMRRKNSFTLLERLRVFPPIERKDDHVVNSGLYSGIDTHKLAYYALSFLWRAGVHVWATIGRQTTALDLVSHKEEIRRYLLGEAPFPKDVAVNMTVCTDLASQLLVFAPARYDGEGHYSL